MMDKPYIDTLRSNYEKMRCPECKELSVVVIHDPDEDIYDAVCSCGFTTPAYNWFNHLQRLENKEQNDG